MPPNFCPLTRGPCRGTKMCDFWARIKLEKKPYDKMVEELRQGIEDLKGNNGKPLQKTIDRYWVLFGIKSMELLSKEKPALYAKMKQAEAEILT